MTLRRRYAALAQHSGRLCCVAALWHDAARRDGTETETVRCVRHKNRRCAAAAAVAARQNGVGRLRRRIRRRCSGGPSCTDQSRQWRPGPRPGAHLSPSVLSAAAADRPGPPAAALGCPTAPRGWAGLVRGELPGAGLGWAGLSWVRMSGAELPRGCSESLAGLYRMQTVQSSEACRLRDGRQGTRYGERKR